METAAVAPVARTYPFTRWAALGGVLYVVLFVIGVIVLFGNEPDGDATPAKVTAYYAKASHRDRVGIGWVLCGLAFFALIWFVGALRRLVTRVDTDGLLAQVTGMGGVLYIALGWAALAVNMGIRTMSDDTYQHQVFPELIHAADDVGWVLHATGAAGLTAMIIASAIALMRAHVWPAWAGWLSIVVGILTLASIAFFPQFLFLLWILIVSLMLFFRPPAVARAA